MRLDALYRVPECHSEQGAEPGPEPNQFGSWSHSLSQTRYAVALVQESLAGINSSMYAWKPPFFVSAPFFLCLPVCSSKFPTSFNYSRPMSPILLTLHVSQSCPALQSSCPEWAPANQCCPLAAVDPCHTLTGWSARLKIPSPQEWEWGWMKKVRVTENPILTSPFFRWKKKSYCRNNQRSWAEVWIQGCLNPKLLTTRP